jgi:hypothetical protein
MLETWLYEMLSEVATMDHCLIIGSDAPQPRKAYRE